MSRRKPHRVFKARRHPSIVRDGIHHVYPPAGSLATKIVAEDRRYFLAHPEQASFLRRAVVGEFAGLPLPSDVAIDDIAYVLVKRIDTLHQARIPLTMEQAMSFKDASMSPWLCDESDESAE